MLDITTIWTQFVGGLKDVLQPVEKPVVESKPEERPSTDSQQENTLE